MTEAARFRQAFSSGKYSELYASATAGFRAAITEQGWVAFCTETQLKLGAWKASTLKDSQVLIVDSGGYIVNIVYATEFATGPATETLSFFVNDGKASLRGYNVDSPMLPRRQF